MSFLYTTTTMEFRWFVLAVLCGVLPSVLCDDNCATYGSVQGQHAICSEAVHLHRTFRPGMNVSTLLDWLRQDCSNADQYYSCMDSYIETCSQRTILSSKLRQMMNYCAGNDVKDWVKDLAFAFDNFDWACMKRIYTDNGRICAAVFQQYIELQPFEQIATSVEDGLQTIANLKSSWMECQMEVIQTAGDVCQTWQESYIALTLALFGTTADRPIGVYLEDSEIDMLLMLASEIHQTKDPVN